VRIAGREKVDELQEENDAVSLCSLYAGSETFGIDTRKIREVLGERDLQRVPMSPLFIAGVVPYRGEVLTTVNLRALLGMDTHAGRSCVLVMEDEEGAERFGLVVDSVGGVVTMSRHALEAGLMVRLDPQKLCPSRLSETGLFKKGTNGGTDASADRR